MDASCAFPWISVTVGPDGPRVDGTPSVSMGHSLLSAPGRPMDGVYARWRWDGARLVAEADRYGLFPLFFAVSGSSLWLSPSPLELVRRGVDATLDVEALSVFMRLGFYIADTTPFRAIRAVPPGLRLEWENGSLRMSGGQFLRQSSGVSWEQAVDGYIDTMRAAVTRRLPADGEYAMPLTGGRDSRHIFLELVRQKRPPREVATVGVRSGFPTNDMLVAKRVADAAGVPQRVVIGGHHGGADAARTFALTHACSDEHQQLTPAREYLASFRRSFDGIGGDILSEASQWAYSQERWDLVRAGKWEEAAAKIVNGHPQSSEELSAHLGRMFGLKLLPSAEIAARVGAEMRKHDGAANPIASFYFWNRTRREIALCPYGMMSNVRTVYAPYLDADVYDFLASIPVDVVTKDRLHSAAIAKAYPEFASIGYTAERPAWGRMKGRVVRFTDGARSLAALTRVAPRRSAVVLGYLSRAARRQGRRATGLLTFGGYLAMLEVARDADGAARMLRYAGDRPVAYDSGGAGTNGAARQAHSAASPAR